MSDEDARYMNKPPASAILGMGNLVGKKTYNNHMDDDEVKKLNKYREQFKKMTDQELLDIKTREIKNPGWVRTKLILMQALSEEIKEREIT